MKNRQWNLLQVLKMNSMSAEGWSILRDLRAWRVFTSSDGGTSTNSQEKVTSDQGAGREKKVPAQECYLRQGVGMFIRVVRREICPLAELPLTLEYPRRNVNGIKTTGTQFSKKEEYKCFQQRIQHVR